MACKKCQERRKKIVKLVTQKRNWMSATFRRVQTMIRPTPAQRRAMNLVAAMQMYPSHLPLVVDQDVGGIMPLHLLLQEMGQLRHPSAGHQAVVNGAAMETNQLQTMMREHLKEMQEASQSKN